MLRYNLQRRACLRQSSQFWCSPTHSASSDFVFSHSPSLKNMLRHGKRITNELEMSIRLSLHVYIRILYAHGYSDIVACTHPRRVNCFKWHDLHSGLHIPEYCTPSMKSLCAFYTDHDVGFTPGSILKQHWSQKLLPDRLVQAFKTLTIRSCLCGTPYITSVKSVKSFAFQIPVPSIAPVSGALVGSSLLGPQAVWTSWDRDDGFWHVMTVMIPVHFVASWRCRIS